MSKQDCSFSLFVYFIQTLAKKIHLKEMPDFFQSGCTILHSHERWARVPVPPHSHGCEVSSLWRLPFFKDSKVCKKLARGCSLSAETMSKKPQGVAALGILSVLLDRNYILGDVGRRFLGLGRNKIEGCFS
ncbi:uncharacterized protein AAG666_015141 isoform 3-T6 [Megaptera novaeangliae]